MSIEKMSLKEWKEALSSSNESLEDYKISIYLEKMMIWYSTELKNLSVSEKKKLFDWLKVIKETLWVDYLKVLFIHKPLKIGNSFYVLNEWQKVSISGLFWLIDTLKHLEFSKWVEWLKAKIFQLNSLQDVEVDTTILDTRANLSNA